ncbi:MAG: hypothetical protein M1818_005533 [Claussenomyces sp. TS43310]|nr:MAG: hypothetical protein M1818_005533 [Claussenomyces sp. TS43310]
MEAKVVFVDRQIDVKSRDETFRILPAHSSDRKRQSRQLGVKVEITTDQALYSLLQYLSKTGTFERPPAVMSESSQPPSQSRQQDLLSQASERLKAASEAQEAASQARQRAEETSDPEEKQQALEEAAKQEKRARSETKLAQRLQSGVWQGGASGAGIGAGFGMGVGAAVGAVVGGVTAIPTTGLGLLAGIGAGAIHGPWLKLPVDKEEKGEGQEDREKEANQKSEV